MKIVYSDRQQHHAPRQIAVRGLLVNNLEVPERLDHLIAAVSRPEHEIVAPRDFGMDGILAVHDGDYVDFLRTAHERWLAAFAPGMAGPYACSHTSPNRQRVRKPSSIQGQVGYYLSGASVPVDAATFEASVAAAHCALEAAALLEEGEREAYALCRPPGHHAYRDMAGGFCYFNNAAIAAERLVAQAGRVAILDIDVHHGNGTQDIFYARGDVFFASIHADPNVVYPFYAGYADEFGEAAGIGCNLNIPVPSGSGDEAFLNAVDAAIAAIGRFEPAALVVSVGFDAFRNDPSADMTVTTDGFRAIGARIGQVAVPIAMIQEGGYLVAELGQNLAAFLDGFKSTRPAAPNLAQEGNR